MNTAAAVANHLNILESAIKEVQEWAHVLFIKFVSGRPRFVSKKVVKMNGTDKQIAWANEIVKEVKFWLNREIKKELLSDKQITAINLAIESNQSAKFWIEKVAKRGSVKQSHLVYALTETIKGYWKLPESEKSAKSFF